MQVLTPAEARIAGCLVEKQLTVPDSYPLTLNGVLAAANQTSNRWPVVQYDERTASDALTSLREKGLTRIVYSPSNRAPKHRHVLDEALRLDAAELALLAVLLLRGPQTTGELRARTERLHPFASLAEVEVALGRLTSREEPLAVRLPRRPGQKDARYGHLLCGPVVEDDGEASGGGRAPDPDRLAVLEEEIRDLRRQVARLYELLGEVPVRDGGPGPT